MTITVDGQSYVVRSEGDTIELLEALRAIASGQRSLAKFSAKRRAHRSAAKLAVKRRK